MVNKRILKFGEILLDISRLTDEIYREWKSSRECSRGISRFVGGFDAWRQKAERNHLEGELLLRRKLYYRLDSVKSPLLSI